MIVLSSILLFKDICLIKRKSRDYKFVLFIFALIRFFVLPIHFPQIHPLLSFSSSFLWSWFFFTFNGIVGIDSLYFTEITRIMIIINTVAIKVKSSFKPNDSK